MFVPDHIPVLDKSLAAFAQMNYIRKTSQRRLAGISAGRRQNHNLIRYMVLCGCRRHQMRQYGQLYAYARLLAEGKLSEGEKINVVVPTGNFGNILAAFYAKNMGLKLPVMPTTQVLSPFWVTICFS